MEGWGGASLGGSHPQDQLLAHTDLEGELAAKTTAPTPHSWPQYHTELLLHLPKISKIELFFIIKNLRLKIQDLQDETFKTDIKHRCTNLKMLRPTFAQKLGLFYTNTSFSIPDFLS